MIIDDAARESLEISKILDIIRHDCRCDLGASLLKNATPLRDASELRTVHELFGAVESYRDKYGDLPWNHKLEAVGYLFEEARASGMLTGLELLSVRRLLQGATRLKEALTEARREWPVFSALLKDLHDFSREEEALAIIEDDGRLCDVASERLRKIREGMKRVRGDIRRKGQNILSDPAIAAMPRNGCCRFETDATPCWSGRTR